MSIVNFNVYCICCISGPVVASQKASEEAVPAPSPQPPSPSKQAAPHQHTPGKPRPAAVRDWTAENVKDWLRDNNLGDLCACLDFCEGSHLEILNAQYRNNEDNFKAEMKSDYTISGPKYLQFTVALKKLFDSTSETVKSKTCMIL